jgi:hypothetical protein
MKAENARLRAELAAEREKTTKLRASEREWQKIADDERKRAIKADDDRDKLREALERITRIEDDKYADDWAEIEEARSIACAVLEETGGGDG